MSLFTKLKTSGIWQTIEVGVMVIAQFLYIAIMARVLSKPDFGLMAIANSFVVFGYIFSESGMGAAIVQKKLITNRHINAALQGGLLFGIVLFLIFFSISSIIANFFLQPILEKLIKVISINFIIQSISSVSLGKLQKEFKFKEKSIVTTLSILISYTIGIILGLYGYGVWSLVVATLLFSILKTIGFFYFAKIKLLNRIYIKEWKELLSFGFGIVLLKLNNYVSSNGIILVLGKIFSPDILGVFERTFKIKTLPSTYIGTILDTIMFPAMSEIQNDNEKLFKIYQHSLGVVNTVLLPIAIYLIYFSKEIVLILLGKDWMEAVIPLQIMFVVLPFSSSGRMADSVLRAKGLVYKNAWRKFLYVIVLILSSAYGAYKYGFIGAALGVTFSYLFNYVTMLFLVRRVFNKSIIEIFLRPILNGSKLAAILIIILLLSDKIFNLGTSILFFLISSIVLGIIVSLLIWKKPSFFGVYLYETIQRFKKKTDSKIEESEGN